MNWDNYKRYFHPDEFRDDQQKVWMTEQHMDMLMVARMIADTPFIITSGCRNPEQNVRVGGSQDSEHLYGKACDIQCIESGDRWHIVNALIKAGFTRIGIGKDFIHAGSSAQHPEEVIWLY